MYSSDKAINSTKNDFLKGYKLTQTGNFSGAVRQFEKVRDLTENRQVAMRDYILYYLAKALHGQGRCQEAKAVFQELLENFPESRWAPVAESQTKSEDSDDRCFLLEQPSLEEPVVDCTSFGDEEDVAGCYFDLRQYKKAKELYKRLCETPSIPCLTRLSQAAARSQDFKTAIEANERLKKYYPRSKVAEEARRKIAFLLQDSGDFAGALPVLQDLVSRSRARDERRQYRERIAWCQFRLGRLPEALKGYDAALDEAETPFSLYWKGRVLEKLGRSKEARVVFRDLVSIYGGTYYGIRGHQRLGEAGSAGGGLADPPRLGPDLNWVESTASFSPSEELERVYELTKIGWVADAEIEARRVRLLKGLRLPTDPKRLLKEKNGDFIVVGRMPKDEVLDFPLPYADTVFSETERQRRESGLALIDPYLVYAMMRQESRYRETIVSPAGAVGLLQIMPLTGLRLAREDGWPDYQVKWLYDPETNIELGVRYLQKLWGLLDGRWYAVVASYNAGESVVAEWLKQRRGLSEEEFIEEIPYRETRDYVKRVYAYWAAYREAYDAGGDIARGNSR